MALKARAGRLWEQTFPLRDYDLALSLDSGQAFRWRLRDDLWEGVIGRRWVRLRQAGDTLVAQTAEPSPDWSWLEDYLQLHVRLDDVMAAFPVDARLQEAVQACRGLRLLRQDVWECLASFILSSTKQIVQIRQIVERLCRRFGEPLAAPRDSGPQFAFPSAERIAGLQENELRKCGMGFRAPYLLATAKQVANGEINLANLASLELPLAREALMKLPGVGRKIADCVLLFGVGHARAFPVDVWILRTMREFYFAGRAVPLKEVLAFVEEHFGPEAGYAQQYLFHYARTGPGDR